MNINKEKKNYINLILINFNNDLIYKYSLNYNIGNRKKKKVVLTFDVCTPTFQRLRWIWKQKRKTGCPGIIKTEVESDLNLCEIVIENPK